LLSATQFVSATDTVGYTTRYSYNTSNQNLELAHALLSITKPDGTQQLFGYDSQGRLTQTSLNGGADSTEYTYGPWHLGSDNGAGPEGQVIVTAADGGATNYSFDSHGLLLQLTNVLGTTQNTYDLNNNLVKKADPDQHNYLYAYNSLGEMV